jgi:hypothetical protein
VFCLSLNKHTNLEEPYDSRKLYELKLLNDDWIQYPVMTISDQDDQTAIKTKSNLFASTAVRGYLKVNLVSCFCICADF